MRRVPKSELRHEDIQEGKQKGSKKESLPTEASLGQVWDKFWLLGKTKNRLVALNGVNGRSNSMPT